MKQDVSVFWFRRDLRLNDNTALYHALRSPYPVVPIFIFDPEILDKLPDKDDKRVSFIHQTLQSLDADLRNHGSSLYVLYDEVKDAIKTILDEFEVKKIFLNHDY
ncbi:deoxyribodipyrimidine photo-lyase, partial [Daejeonella sp.]|uniref:deoxyribodipyrimidine photo-lyase n=1 Tax=Daejeonella sp. TaxID=2805397 RepID=UPI0030C33235